MCTYIHVIMRMPDVYPQPQINTTFTGRLHSHSPRRTTGTRVYPSHACHHPNNNPPQSANRSACRKKNNLASTSKCMCVHSLGYTQNFHPVNPHEMNMYIHPYTVSTHACAVHVCTVARIPPRSFLFQSKSPSFIQPHHAIPTITLTSPTPHPVIPAIPNGRSISTFP